MTLTPPLPVVNLSYTHFVTWNLEAVHCGLNVMVSVHVHVSRGLNPKARDTPTPGGPLGKESRGEDASVSESCRTQQDPAEPHDGNGGLNDSDVSHLDQWKCRKQDCKVTNSY